MSVTTRKTIDCREYPGDMHCAVAIADDTDRERIDAAVQHAVAVRGDKGAAEFRQQIAGAMHEGTPLLKAKSPA